MRVIPSVGIELATLRLLLGALTDRATTQLHLLITVLLIILLTM